VFLGEQLETVHIERQRAQAACDLIDYYNQFSRDDTSRIDALKKEGKDGRRQVAVLLRRLNTVAKEVDLPTADKVCPHTLSDAFFLTQIFSFLFRLVKPLKSIAKSLRKIC
jgi:Exocyst complex component Sec10